MLKEIYNIKKLLFTCLAVMVLFQLSSCSKYLDKKAKLSLEVPDNLSDFEEVLDNQTINTNSANFSEVLADNYYLTNSDWNNLGSDDLIKNYIWAQDAQVNQQSTVWNSPYHAISTANFILDYLPSITITEAERSRYDAVVGSCYFARAFMFHQLAQLFCRPWSSSAETDLGIIVRTSSDIEIVYPRASVKQTYEQIINDLKKAAALLPASVPFSTRPNKPAAYGALARVYLSMRDYENARKYADTSLSLYSTLLNYNTLTPVNAPKLPLNFLANPEVIFLSGGNNEVMRENHIALMDTLLYRSYDDNDIRKKVFFDNTVNGKYWKGSYYDEGGTTHTIFNGIAVDEVYLIRAESRVRTSDINGGMDDLNTLMSNRWVASAFSPFTASDSTAAINLILAERRKELVFRDIRWSDLRRLNEEGADITLTRIINNVTYTLPPNDLRWVLPIPDREILMSGVPQNPR